jgi:hypothetical protein
MRSTRLAGWLEHYLILPLQTLDKRPYIPETILGREFILLCILVYDVCEKDELVFIKQDVVRSLPTSRRGNPLQWGQGLTNPKTSQEERAGLLLT